MGTLNVSSEERGEFCRNRVKTLGTGGWGWGGGGGGGGGVLPSVFFVVPLSSFVKVYTQESLFFFASV